MWILAQKNRIKIYYYLYHYHSSIDNTDKRSDYQRQSKQGIHCILNIMAFCQSKNKITPLTLDLNSHIKNNCINNFILFSLLLQKQHMILGNIQKSFIIHSAWYKIFLKIKIFQYVSRPQICFLIKCVTTVSVLQDTGMANAITAASQNSKHDCTQ